MKLLPLEFADTCRYFKSFSDEDKALIYGIAGGTPQYLLQMDDRLSVEDNIKNTFLNSASSLFEEPENLLKQEVREPALYNAIVTAVATGASRMAEISTKVGNKRLRSLFEKPDSIGIDSKRNAVWREDVSKINL